MPAIVSVRDETLAGDVSPARPLELKAERTTLRELIRASVYQDVQDHNRAGRRSPEDWQARFEQAVAGFMANRILVLVNERQIDGLDEAIEVPGGSAVTFLRLTPLVGG